MEMIRKPTKHVFKDMEESANADFSDLKEK